ncbi:MAG TPA: beta-ketoacyl synthase N-terminal-like domain-containing protein [Candidatus Limnocylindria bacterium]|nr:beta-ketoacyl synthase N-terminal-like domain-containing protein [Candidatus Limnocylindria bacterium]
MTFRAAFVVSTVGELREHIASLARDGKKRPGCHWGSALDKAVARFSHTDAGLEQISKLAEARELEKLAELWTRGHEISWSVLWVGQPVARLAGLPTYPFAGDRYGLPGGMMWKDIKGPLVRRTMLHPLLGENSSNLGEQRYSTVFTGEEPFFTDHIVNGQPVFPASACLEMARAAIQLASPKAVAGASQVQLLGVAWIRPLNPVRGIAVHIRLVPDTGGDILFEIYREGTVAGENAEVFCQGRARIGTAKAVPSMDVESLVKDRATLIPGAACYERLRLAGMDYGPAHQAIESLSVGHGTICARLVMPPIVVEMRDEYVIHPSLLDGAIQSLLGMGAEGVKTDGTGAKVGLAPFAVEAVEVHGPCRESSWAVIVEQPPAAGASGRLRKFDVDLCDDLGRVSVRMKGLACRSLLPNSEMPADRALPKAATSDAPNGLMPNGSGGAYTEEVVRYVKRQIASVLRTSPDQMDADSPLEDYGIDSAMVVALTQHLEKTFGVLDKTLFFEYRSVRELAGYFLRSFPSRLQSLLGKGNGNGKSAHTVGTVADEPVPISSSSTLPTARFITGPVAPASQSGAIDIAIIGVSGRYPGARNLEEFWENLRAGRDCITEVPKERWNHDVYFDPEKKRPGSTYSKWGGFLDGVDEFDARFFNISAWEAEMMDPQERLFLECAFSAIEDAGYTREGLSSQGQGRVGVYVGVMYEEYQLYGAEETVRGRPLALFGSPASIANRVSYFCNFRGPSLAVDTMCSSSLTAIHLACQSLARGECRAAMAGGVNVSVHPNKYIVLGQGRFVSSKGRCESFGEGAEGYVPGEGVGAVILKPLAAALADGDRIYGVIKSTAVNHGGKNNGYTVPNPQAQAEVIELALGESGISPRTISYMEAHGTGTSLGDPIEIAGLKKAFEKYTGEYGFCAIGSVKSNIGHCESAAGIAGLTKVLLQMAHGQIVPSLHSATLNPNIDFDRSPFVVQQELTDWPRPVIEVEGVSREFPRRAGLSSFGAGGSNAHVIIEEFKAEDVDGKDRPVGAGMDSGQAEQASVFVLSAKTAPALREAADRLLRHLQGMESVHPPSLADLAYTLQTGREAMDERLAFVARNHAEAQAKLASFLQGGTGEDFYQGRAGKNNELLSIFGSDEQLQGVIASWAREQHYSKLLDLWVRGLNIHWSQLHVGEKPRRVKLPGYPFARERHWIVKTEVPSPKDLFDSAFYENLLHEVAEGTVSVEDGVALEHQHVHGQNGESRTGRVGETVASL